MVIQNSINRDALLRETFFKWCYLGLLAWVTYVSLGLTLKR